MRNILAIFLTISILLPVSAMGEIIIIKNPVKQIFGSVNSLDDARIFTMAQAKMESLETEKQSAEEFKKNNQQVYQGLTAADWLKKALSLWDGEKYTDPKKAIEYLSNAIKLQPDDADAYNSRGNAYYKLGQYQRAIEDYNEVIRLKPDHVNAHYSRGNTYYKLGQYQRAMEDLKIAAGLGHEVAQIILKSYGSGKISPDISAAKKPDTVDADQYYKGIKGIVLMNGTVIEGQIVSIAPDSVKIRLKDGNILSYDFNEVEQVVIRTPGKQYQLSIEKVKPYEEAARQYKAVKGIALKNGDIVEGQIISITPDQVKIRTKDGLILSYDFNEAVQGFIKDDVAVIKTTENKPKPLMEKTRHSVDAGQQYKRITGIVLRNGDVVEGQIISITPDQVKIRTKDGLVSSYDFNEEVQEFIKDDAAVIKTPENKSQQSMENTKPYEEPARQYKAVKGIVLKNGDVVEGQIISIKPDRARIRTKDGKILSYDIHEEVQGFIKDDVAIIKTPENKPQPSMENEKPYEEATRQYKGMKGIELMNGDVIEGQIISVTTDILKIRTKEGKILSYSFKKEVLRFIEK